MSSSIPSPRTLIGGTAKVEKPDSAAARFVAAGAAGIAEVIVFHPVDTVAKRLMFNKSRITSASQLDTIIFKDYVTEPRRRFLTLFPGLGYAAAFKVLQRVHKYGGQPFVRDFLSKHYRDSFDQRLGSSSSKAMIHAMAGSLVGISEIVLLPLDILKIKRQTNPEAFCSRSALSIVCDERSSLYRGWGWTAARNATGSFALFGGFAAAMQYLFALEDYSSATWFQNLIASSAGSLASIVISAPLDVVKTRIQSQNFEVKDSGTRIVSSMLRHEGPTAFFKALVPKLLMTGPKLTFSFWLAQTLTAALSKVYATSLVQA